MSHTKIDALRFKQSTPRFHRTSRTSILLLTLLLPVSLLLRRTYVAELIWTAVVAKAAGGWAPADRDAVGDSSGHGASTLLAPGLSEVVCGVSVEDLVEHRDQPCKVRVGPRGVACAVQLGMSVFSQSSPAPRSESTRSKNSRVARPLPSRNGWAKFT